jgi:hypothetical protein
MFMVEEVKGRVEFMCRNPPLYFFAVLTRFEVPKEFQSSGSTPSTQRCQPSFNNIPYLGATFKLLVVIAISFCGDLSLYYRFAVQTSTPSGLETDGNGWKPFSLRKKTEERPLTAS